MEHSTIGDRLKNERVRLNKSQAELAEIGGVGRVSQLKYESNERNPDTKYLAKVAKSGVDIQFVITGIKTVEPKVKDERFDIYQNGTREELTDHVMGLIESALKSYGHPWEHLPPTRKRALVNAAYRYQMDEQEMIWYYKNANQVCGSLVMTKEEFDKELEDTESNNN